MASARLWAPWRMEYIRGPKPAGCVLCAAASAGPAQRRRKLVLCARPGAYALLNRYPFAAGHVMVVPRRHAADLAELAADEHAQLFALVRDAVAALRAACAPQGINVGINLGAAAGAGIAEHLHVHVVPRWHGDTNFLPVLADTRVMPEALDTSWARLAPHFAPLSEPAVRVPAAPRRPARGAR